MGLAIIECFKTEEEANNYIEQCDSECADRYYVLYEPDFDPDLPWTVCID